MTGAPRSPRPRLPAWARVLVTMLAFPACTTIAGLVLLVPWAVAALEGSDDVAALLAFGLLSTVALLAYLGVSALLVRGIDRRPWRDLGLNDLGRGLPALGAGIALAVLVALAGSLLAETLGLGRVMTSVPGPTGQMDDLSAVPLWIIGAWLFLHAFVLQGIGEEVLFRGYLLQSLRSRPRTAVLVSAAAFAIPHLNSSGGQASTAEHIAYLAIPLGFGLTAAVLAILLRSAWAAVGIHGGFHVGFAGAGALGWPTQGSVVSLLLGGAFTLLALVLAWRIPQARWAQFAAHGHRTPVP